MKVLTLVSIHVKNMKCGALHTSCLLLISFQPKQSPRVLLNPDLMNHCVSTECNAPWFVFNLVNRLLRGTSTRCPTDQKETQLVAVVLLLAAQPKLRRRQT